MALDPSKDPNFEFLTKLKGERNLRILLSQRQAQRESEGDVTPDPEAGLMPANHPENRLMPKANPYINFYDMGRKWNGSTYEDVLYTVAPTYDFVIGGGGTATYRTTTVPTLAQLETLQNQIVDYEIASIESQHPRITEAEGEYFKLLLGDIMTAGTNASLNEGWTDKGWKTTQAEIDEKTNFVIGATPNTGSVSEESASPFFHHVVLTGASKHKITSEYDPDATAVPFIPRMRDKYFLMPAMPRPNAWARYKDIGTNHGLGTGGLRAVDRFESFDFMVLPRLPVFDSTSPYYLLNHGDNSNAWHSGTPSTDAEYDLAHITLNYMEAYGSNALQKESVNQNATFNDWFWRTTGTVYGTGMPPSEHFPSETTPPSAVDAVAWQFGSGMFFGTFLMDAGTATNSLNPSLPVGALMAIIKQGGNIYYVWRS